MSIGEPCNGVTSVAVELRRIKKTTRIKLNEIFPFRLRELVALN